MAEVMIPILRVAHAANTAQWYARMGFEVTGVHRFEPHMPAYMFLKRGDVQLHLSEHTGDATPNTLMYFWVEDIDAIAAEFGVKVTRAPWAREAELTDPDGNRLRLGEAT